MSSLWTDLRLSLRSLAASPLLTAAIVVSLVLGIGLNTALFTILNSLFLRPVPALRDPARVITLFTHIASSPAFFPVSYRNARDLAARNHSCTHLAAFQTFRLGLATGGPGAALPLNGEMVSFNYFDLVGEPMTLGRGFIPAEDEPDHALPVVVISDLLWRQRFAAGPAALGAKLLIDGQPFTVIGVAPRGFAGMTPVVRADLWVPIATYRTVFPFPELFALRSTQALRVAGRLRPQASVATAAAEFALLGAQLEREYPDDNRGQVIVTFPLGEGALPPSLRPKVRRAAVLLLAAVGLLLVMSCINIANLLLARSLARAREMAIRLSLGSPRRRLIQQLIVESLLLALTAGVFSLAFAVWCRNLFWRFRPPFLEQSSLALGLDGTVLTFTLILSLATGLLFGLVPALQATRPDIVAELKGAAAANTVARTRALAMPRLREALLGVQLCLCTLTLSSTVFFVKSLYNALSLNPGFSVKDVVVLSFDFTLENYDEGRSRAFETRMLDKVRNLPFVRSAAIAENRLLGGFRLWENVYPAGRTSSLREGGVYAGSTLVGPDYFATTGIPLLSGREFAWTDTSATEPAAIINQTMAAKIFPRQNPVGRSILIEGEKEPVRVIGIAMNSSYTTLGQNLLPFLYLSLVQHYSPRVTLHVRLTQPSDAAIDRLRREVQALDPTLPLLEVRSIPDVVTGSLWAHTLSTVLLAVLSLIALALAATGIYGLAAHLVTVRRREMGVRLALGASRWRVLRMVLIDNSPAVLAGTVCGLIAAALGKSALAGFLYASRSPREDLLLMPAVALFLVGVVALASLSPALRAAHTDPAVSLRSE